MKKLLVVAGAVLAIPVAGFLLQGVASESGEVVLVRTTDDAGGTHETRVWIVDDEGTSWLRAGRDAAGWYTRLAARPEIEVVRGGETLRVRALPEPDRRARVNELMREKYGWADAYISFLVMRGGSVPIRLVPR